MTAVSDVAQRPTFGPLPSTSGIGKRLTIHHGRLRSAFAGMGAAELGQLREAMDLAVAVPAVRARMLEELARTMQIIAGAVAERSGRPAADFEVQAIAVLDE